MKRTDLKITTCILLVINPLNDLGNLLLPLRHHLLLPLEVGEFVVQVSPVSLQPSRYLDTFMLIRGFKGYPIPQKEIHLFEYIEKYQIIWGVKIIQVTVTAKTW